MVGRRFVVNFFGHVNQNDELCGQFNCYRETNSAIFAATTAIESSTVSKPLREASNGLTLRRASYVVLCTMGTSWLPAKSAESSLSATLSLGRRASSAGVTSTSPIREFARPLSIARIIGTPRPRSFSLNQTLTPAATSNSCNSFAGPCRSSHAWHRNTSRRSGCVVARVSMVWRIGVSDCTWAGVYDTDAPAFDQRGFGLLLDLPPTLP